MTRLIGLGGLKESGKDTVADDLVDRYGYVKIQMSEPLHDALMVMNPLIPVPLEVSGLHRFITRVLFGRDEELMDFRRYANLVADVGYVEAKRNPEVRRLLIDLGTNVVRKMVDDDAWVNLAKERIRQAHRDGHNVVVTGIRMPNELRMIRNLNGYSVWVDRPVPRTDDPSENSVMPNDFQWSIFNHYGLDHLSDEVDVLQSVVNSELI